MREDLRPKLLLVDGHVCDAQLAVGAEHPRALRQRSCLPWREVEHAVRDQAVLPAVALTDGGAGLGTLGLPEPRLRELALEAGFSSVRRLPVDNPFNNVYELMP